MSAPPLLSARPKACLRPPDVFTIPAHVAFTDALAAGLLARFRDDGPLGALQLARVHVLLPNRRAVRALTDAFVRASADKGLLLPRMTPVGDLDGASDFGGFERFAAGDTPPAMALTPLRRRLELARLVRRFGEQTGRFGARGTRMRGAVEALRLADELGSTLDALVAEEIDPARLSTEAVDADLAAHWGPTLQFLDIIIGAWPAVRDASGAGEGGTRLALLIDQTIAHWARQGAGGPVVAAGILASAPAIGRLMAAVARLDGGMVVLPGLDTGMTSEAWEAIHCRLDAAEADERPPRDSEEHPQFVLKCLLARLGVRREAVRQWGVTTPLDGPAGRTAMVAAAMAPAATIIRDAGAAPLAGVTAIEAATPAEEAQAIALALRRALDTDGATAALVTPDRSLARRVAAHCRRFGIDIDDSAGTPLRQTPPGALALALVEAGSQGFAPVALLAALKHPLVRAGDRRLDWLTSVRRLDRILRGVRPPPGLEAVGEHIDAWDSDPHHAPSNLGPWWDGVAAQLEPLAMLDGSGLVTLPAVAAALRTTGQALCGDRLWSGPDGRALAQLVDALETDGDVFGAFDAADAAGLAGALLADVAVRPPYGKHPRLAILGPLEARLQRSDLMILGGLNDGVWPRRPSPDPWLAPAIRTRLGLPGTLRDAGLAAHDFVQALGAKQVILTRARRDDSGPTIPSRLWLRLQAFSGGVVPDAELLTLARGLDGGGEAHPVDRPAPSPPPGTRPRALVVTEVDTLASDPYAFYARNILGLRAWDPLDQEPTPSERGTLIHDVLESWSASGGGTVERLMRGAEQMLAKDGRAPLLRALWAPRVRRMIEWAGQQVIDRERQGWEVIAAEAGGSMTLTNGIVLRGRADRIDRDAAGRLAVVDYKTGAPPKRSQVRSGFANQLGLIAVMAAAGRLATKSGFQATAGVIAEIAYWQLKGGRDPGTITDPLGGREPVDPADHLDFVMARVTRLTSDLLLGGAPFLAKVRPLLSRDDYDHLARVAEWLGRPDRPA